MTGIYKITNLLNGHCYVGLSRNIPKRWSDYRTPRTLRSNRVICRAMRKHGVNNFRFETLEECAIDKLAERERYWIALLRPEYNMNAGGLGNCGHTVSSATRKRLSVAAKRQWELKPEQDKAATIARLTGPGIGHLVSQETRTILRSANLGKRWSAARRESQPTHYNFGNENGCKRITSLTIHGLRTEALLFESVQRAAAHFKINPESLSVILRRWRNKSTAGYLFREASKSMNENESNQPVEILAPSAIMAMERAQIDTQVATAHQYPRSMERFKKSSLAMVQMDEETAESCIYCRPVGKEKNANGEWMEKYAEGPSIRLAEIVAASYGNIRIASRIIEQTERFVRCEGVAHDLESNYAGKSECMESTVTKDGKPYSERQRALVAKVCLAKAYRDACFKVVPRALCKPAMEAAKKVSAAADRPIEERRKKARAWVASLKIDEQRVFAALGVKSWEVTTGDDLLKLTGLKTAIGDGDENIDTVFPPVDQGTKAPEPTAQQKMQQGQATTPQSTATATAATSTQEKKPEQGPGLGDDNLNMGEKSPGGEPSTTATTTTQTTPVEESKDPALQPSNGDTPDIIGIKDKVRKAGCSLNQLFGVLRGKKLMKDDQKNLSELATAKLEGINRNVERWVEDMRKIPA